MAIRVGINGFGRIGRQAFKAMVDNYWDDIEVVGINDLFPPASFSLLLRYDSVYGRFGGTVETTAQGLVFAGRHADSLRRLVESMRLRGMSDEELLRSIPERLGYYYWANVLPAHTYTPGPRSHRAGSWWCEPASWGGAGASGRIPAMPRGNPSSSDVPTKECR